MNFPCPICGRLFASSQSRSNHRRGIGACGEGGLPVGQVAQAELRQDEWDGQRHAEAFADAPELGGDFDLPDTFSPQDGLGDQLVLEGEGLNAQRVQIQEQFELGAAAAGAVPEDAQAGARSGAEEEEN